MWVCKGPTLNLSEGFPAQLGRCYGPGRRLWLCVCVFVLAEEVRLDCEGVIEDIEYP